LLILLLFTFSGEAFTKPQFNTNIPLDNSTGRWDSSQIFWRMSSTKQ